MPITFKNKNLNLAFIYFSPISLKDQYHLFALILVAYNMFNHGSPAYHNHPPDSHQSARTLNLLVLDGRKYFSIRWLKLNKILDIN